MTPQQTTIRRGGPAPRRARRGTSVHQGLVILKAFHPDEGQRSVLHDFFDLGDCGACNKNHGFDQNCDQQWGHGMPWGLNQQRGFHPHFDGGFAWFDLQKYGGFIPKATGLHQQQWDFSSTNMRIQKNMGIGVPGYLSPFIHEVGEGHLGRL